MNKFPLQFQADIINAHDPNASVLCHVFDDRSAKLLFEALQKYFLHVVVYNSEGYLIREYDNR